MSIADDIKKQADQVFTGEYDPDPDLEPDIIRLNIAPVGAFTIYNNPVRSHVFTFSIVYDKRPKMEIELPSNYIVMTNA